MALVKTSSRRRLGFRILVIDVDADMGYWRCRTRHLSRARRPKLSGPIVWAVGIRRCFVEKKKKMPIDPKVTVPTHTRRERRWPLVCWPAAPTVHLLPPFSGCCRRGEQCRLMKGEVASASFFDFFCLVFYFRMSSFPNSSCLFQTRRLIIKKRTKWDSRQWRNGLWKDQEVERDTHWKE